MNKQKLATRFLMLTMLVVTAFVPMTLADDQAKDRDKAAKRTQEAVTVFDDIMNVGDKSIPRELLERAEAIAVFPGVIKAAFIIGGRGGQGIISRRTTGGWSAPAFFNLGGGSFGAQIGATKTDYVFLIMNDGGLKGLLADKFEIGGELGATAGPVGRDLSATTTPTLDAGILSYSRSKGAFIGAAIKGAVITPDKDLNSAVYNLEAREILDGRAFVKDMPIFVRDFPRTLNRYSPRTATSDPKLSTNNKTENNDSRERVVNQP